MSSTLLRRGLELFDDDLTDTSKDKKKQKTKEDPMKLISSNKQGIKKELKKLKQKNSSKKKRKIKSLHDELHKYKSVDKTEDNLDFISRLSQLDGPSSDAVSKIVEQNRGHLSKNQVAEEKEEEPESVFSDRDFDKFEKEYDFFK